MGWGKTRSNASVPRLTAIQVQTSAKNVAMGRGWGTFRANCNLLDYTDFNSTPIKTRTGKGFGGSILTGYNYSATVLLGIVSGPIVGIRTTWIDKGRFDDISTTGLSYMTGEFGQAVWAYMTGSHPDQALGYSGIAYAYARAYSLGQGASLPNHAFEVQSEVRAVVGGDTIDDADPADIISDILENPYHGVPSWPAGAVSSLTDFSDYCFANGLFFSPYLDAQRSAAQVIRELVDAASSDVVFSGGQIKIVPYGDTEVTGNGVTWTPNLTPVYDLTVDSFLAEDGEDPVKIMIKRPTEAYNSVQIGYLERSQDYAEDVMPAMDQANIDQYGLRKEDVKSYSFICNADTAKRVATIRVQRACYVRRTFKFRLDWRYQLLEPMDVVSITLQANGLDLDRQLVRIIAFDESEDGDEFTVEAEEILVGTSSAPLYGAQAGSGLKPNYDVAPGPVEANLLLWSQDFDDATWSKTNVTITADTTTAPDGTATADTATIGTSGTNTLGEVVSVTPDIDYVFTFYVKRGTATSLLYRVYDITHSADIVAPTSYYADTSGAAWTRIEIPFTAPAGCISARVDLLANCASTGTVYVWGAALTPTAARDYVRTWSAPAVPVLFNPPTALTPAGIEAWAAAAGGSNWGGADVYLSLDGINYSLMGTMTERSRYGFVSADLPDHADPDSTNTLSVDLSQSRASLDDATNDDADLGVTQLMVGNEVLTYGTATATADFMYDLDYLRRGFLNTVSDAHDAGTSIVRLDTSVFKFGYLGIQAGQVVHVKFVSFNVYGRAYLTLDQCLDYAMIPVPVGAREPASAAWAATGTAFANYGTSIPAILITATGSGSIDDNPEADGVIFSYRVSGTTQWTDDRVQPFDVTRAEITSVTTQTDYDVAVRYVVNGTPGARLFIDTVTVGDLSTEIADGTILWSDGTPGAGKTFTLPAGSYTHIDIQLVGPGGAGNYIVTGGGGKGGGGTADFYGGGGAGFSEKTGIAITAGSTTITYTITAGNSEANATASIVSPAVSLTAGPGLNASTSAVGSGGSASGGTTNTSGDSGGAVNSWDGGASGDPTCFTQSTNGVGGNTPGGGGAGAVWSGTGDLYYPANGAGARIIIIART